MRLGSRAYLAVAEVLAEAGPRSQLHCTWLLTGSVEKSQLAADMLLMEGAGLQPTPLHFSEGLLSSHRRQLRYRAQLYRRTATKASAAVEVFEMVTANTICTCCNLKETNTLHSLDMNVTSSAESVAGLWNKFTTNPQTPPEAC